MTITQAEGNLLDQPMWEVFERHGKINYTRPMIGSESYQLSWHNFGDGMGDVTLGLTFTTSLEVSVFAETLKHALCYVRFISPLLASTAEKGVHDPQLWSWVYTPASDAAEVEQWATDTLEVVEGPDPDQFVNSKLANRLPYTRSNGLVQYWKLFLLKTEGDQLGLFIHGIHAVFDAHPNFNLFQILFEEVACPDPTHQVNSLPWGEEWKSLAPGIISATGGPRPGWDTEGMELVRFFKEQLTSSVVRFISPSFPVFVIADRLVALQPTHALRSARPKITDMSKVIRIVEVVDRETSRRIIQGTKRNENSLTQLFEAAAVLATFTLNPDFVGPAEEAHVTLDVSFISLMKYLVPPYDQKSYIAGCSALVPLKIPYSSFMHEENPLKQICRIMDCVRAQYSRYLSNPHLPHLTARLSTLMPLMTSPELTWSNQCATIMTNIGVIERLMRFKYYSGDPGRDPEVKPAITVDNLHFGHRVAHGLRL
ncbi:uncharacterized protein FIBRA_09601 [Fibroporia radiculosa]|uniref:Condensation domain-containing protein n=1 Tax=Fibroporia radiculosa TaxID=599839 RepID=J7RWD7_9APHY|nr:uncharacterized protein FIBRA_09601 [Fibroporia radiculosa]CCM07255.1 predicted protein [Fibroporia radiculosa]